MDKLKKLMALCESGVHLTVNDHLGVYETASLALEKLEFCMPGLEIDPDVRAKIIETDTLIDLLFYPDNPVGFYRVLHHDLDSALDEALAAVGAV